MPKTKIVVTNTGVLSQEQKVRLEKLGEVKYYQEMPTSGEEWLNRVKGFDVVCSGINGLREKYGDLENVLISVPFVGVSSFADTAVLKAKKITLCNSPGCNRHAVSEWIIFMMVWGMRGLGNHVNTSGKVSIPLNPPSVGLAGKNVTILGKGNIGKRAGAICEALEMKVKFFERERNLLESIKDADVVIDVLSTNPETKNLLNDSFFSAFKKGAGFITITVHADIEAMIKALDKGILSFAAHDVMVANLGDVSNSVYQKLYKHPKVLTTPHLASLSDVSNHLGNDIMIDNVEAWLKGKPINVFS